VSLERTDLPVGKHAPGGLLEWLREFRRVPRPSAESHETRRQEKKHEIGNADHDKLGEHQAFGPSEQPSGGADRAENDVRKRQDQDRLCRRESAPHEQVVNVSAVWRCRVAFANYAADRDGKKIE